MIQCNPDWTLDNCYDVYLPERGQMYAPKNVAFVEVVNAWPLGLDFYLRTHRWLRVFLVPALTELFALLYS